MVTLLPSVKSLSHASHNHYFILWPYGLQWILNMQGCRVMIKNQTISMCHVLLAHEIPFLLFAIKLSKCDDEQIVPSSSIWVEQRLLNWRLTEHKYNLKNAGKKYFIGWVLMEWKWWVEPCVLGRNWQWQAGFDTMNSPNPDVTEKKNHKKTQVSWHEYNCSE